MSNAVWVAGEVPMPTLAAYGASKAALAVFSKAMRLELLQWGMEVVLIQPAGFRTSGFSNLVLSDFSELHGCKVRNGLCSVNFSRELNFPSGHLSYCNQKSQLPIKAQLWAL